ncbi:MAG: hypothetical protein OXH70_04290 [Acidobacteria bacterium]|nr:hypothetical protein [Acidobacteriota bacterium]
METKNSKRCLRTLVAATLLSGAAVALAPAVAEAQVIICSIYWNSTTDDYSNFCYGSGSGCIECVIIEYSTGGNGGEGPLDPLRQQQAATSEASLLDNQGTHQPVGLASGTGLPRLSLNEEAARSRVWAARFGPPNPSVSHPPERTVSVLDAFGN